MAIINSFVTKILSSRLPETRDFYCSLFNFDVVFESDWFINLKSGQIEIGIISPENEITPSLSKGKTSGVYVTFVVKSCDKVYELAKQNKYKIISEPEDTFYGQRRMLLEDPNGLIVDISSIIS